MSHNYKPNKQLEDDIAPYLTRMSLGYFIYDFIDMYRKGTSSFEMTIHHTAAIILALITITSGEYLGLAMIGTLMEVNSIFLHMR